MADAKKEFREKRGDFPIISVTLDIDKDKRLQIS